MSSLSRRRFLALSVAFVPACSSTAPSEAAGDSAPSPPATSTPDAGGPVVAQPGEADAASDVAVPTPTCDDATEDDPEGPYYTAGAPTRTTLVESGMIGTRLVVAGRVLAAGKTCNALAGAEVDVWQANDAGDYDNVGFVLRGVFVTDAMGRFRIETIVPGRYLNGAEYRPRHIHVIVRAAGHANLTTQLYFEGDPFNASDGMFRPSLVLIPKPDGAGGEIASFDFVLAP